MTGSIFDDPEILEELSKQFEQVKTRASKEGRDEPDIIKEMEEESFRGLKSMIDEEVDNNMKRRLREKYTAVSNIDAIFDVKKRLESTRIALCAGTVV